MSKVRDTSTEDYLIDIGFSWDSVDGKKTIVKQETSRLAGWLEIDVENLNLNQFIHHSEIVHEVNFDTKQLERKVNI